MGPDGVTAGVSALANTRATSDQVGSDGDSKPATGTARALHATAWLSGSMPSARSASAPLLVWRHTPQNACAEGLRTSLPPHKPVSGTDVERDALYDVTCALARVLIPEEVGPRPGRRERDSAGARAYAQALGGPDLHAVAQWALMERRAKLLIEFEAGSTLSWLTRRARCPTGRAHVKYGWPKGAIRCR